MKHRRGVVLSCYRDRCRQSYLDYSPIYRMIYASFLSSLYVIQTFSLKVSSFGSLIRIRCLPYEHRKPTFYKNLYAL